MPVKKITVHFVGIGGIGVSALAQYFLARNFHVSGSDLASSEITKLLKNKGAKIKIGQHKKENLPQQTKILIHSPAAHKNNPEIIEAQKRGIIIQSYPQALGELTRKFFTIAVSGTHGKSTTASMISLLMVKAKMDPTVVIGTKLKEFGNSNFRAGKSQYLVIEADEHFASFLNYSPRIIVLTNIEADHLDYYGNFNNLIKTFRKYVKNLPKNGFLLANKDSKVINKLKINKINNWKVKEYSLKQPAAKKLKEILRIPGEHNLSNALAALTVARTLRIPDKTAFKILSEYRGAWRRFEEKEIKIGKNNIRIISDYGHHPTEIMATVKAAREKYSRARIRLIYQPHQYQRTYYLLSDFIKVFRQAPVEEIIITDIYDVAGREEKKLKKKIDSQKLAKKINKPEVFYLAKDKILEYLKKSIKTSTESKDLSFNFADTRMREVIIIMGAGDIYKIVDSLTNKKKKNKIK